MRLENVAVPAHAHVVYHVERQTDQRRLGRRGKLHRRMDGRNLVGGHGQPASLVGELPRDDVDFVSAFGEFWTKRWVHCSRPPRSGSKRSTTSPTLIAAPLGKGCHC